jgi:hypothetical protein
VSDFLVRLARRGAGLTPAVRARATPPPAPPEAAAAAAAGEVEAPRNVGVPALTTTPVTPALGPAPPILSREPALTTRPAPIVAVPAPLGEPLPLAAVPPARPGPPVAPAASPRTPPAEALGPPGTRVVVGEVSEADAAPRAPLPEVEHLPARRIETRIERAAAPAPPTESRPSSIDGSSPLPSPQTPVRATGAEDIQVVERLIERAPVGEPRVEVAAAPLASAIEPAPTTPPLRSLPDPAPERVIQVRIGAIEIHAPQPVAPAAPLAPSAPATAPPPPPAGGFDDFASLRSYAPWRW